MVRPSHPTGWRPHRILTFGQTACRASDCSTMSDASAAVSSVSVSTARSTPKGATALGVGVATKGPIPRQVGLNRAALEANGFTGAAGQTIVVPGADGIVVAVGIGTSGDIDANGCAPPRRRSPGPRRSTLDSRPIWPTSTGSTPRPPGRRSPRACCSPRTATSA